MEQEKGSFEEVRTRLEEIVDEVNAEDISLDDALKLYEEAVKLGLSACELSESDIFPQQEPGDETVAAEAEAEGQSTAHVDEGENAAPVEGDSVASNEAFENAYEASDIAEAAAIEHFGDAASVQFPESVESVEQTEVEDDGSATYPR